MNILQQASTYQGLAIAGAVGANMAGLPHEPIINLLGIVLSIIQVFIAKN